MIFTKSSSNKMAEFSSPDLLETPELQYLRKKERFLQQFRKNAFGKENEKLKELMAADVLQNYVKDVLKTASELDDYESHNMYKDLRILILDAQILPSIPDWIREEMFELTRDFKVGSGRKQVKAFVEFLEDYKGICYIHSRGNMFLHS